MADEVKTLANAGEFGLLSRILPTIPGGDRVLLGPGDDGAVFRVRGDLVVSTDALVEGVHFRRDWSSAHDIGRKAVAVNVADIEAMGARPTTMVMGFSAPGDTPLAWVEEFMAGVIAEAQLAGINLVGGDTTRSRDVTICVTVMGETDGIAPVTRSGACPGDVLAIKGRLGWAAAGLAVLLRGFRSPRLMVDAQRCPEPPYGAGRIAAIAGATAMIDISDGLVNDVGHIADLSKVAIDIDSTSLELPEAMLAVAQATGRNPLEFLLGGGEDHALLSLAKRFLKDGLLSGRLSRGLGLP